MKSKNIIITVLAVLIVLMGIAYAAFSTTLNISGTASIDSTWKIVFAKGDECLYFTGNNFENNGDIESITGSVDMQLSGNVATITADMLAPGDYAHCVIEVWNKGTLNAELVKFETILSDEAKQYYNISAYLAPEYENLLLSLDGAKEMYPDFYSEEHTFQRLYIDIDYKDNVTTKPSGPITFTAVATYQQAL